MLYGNIFCVYPVHIPNYSFNVADKSVRNFDMVSYHRGNPKRFPLFFMVAGGGLMSSVISTIHPNPPLSALRFFSLLRFGKTNEFVLLSP